MLTLLSLSLVAWVLTTKWYSNRCFWSTKANPDLQWEKTATTNIGLDFTLAKSKLSGSIEFYNKNTTGMIYSYSVDPIKVPTGSIVANGGSINNKGVELTLNAKLIQQGAFSWNSTLNLAHNSNVITSLTNPLFAGGDSYYCHVQKVEANQVVRYRF
jgi:iron complex outermembrane receptor protein